MKRTGFAELPLHYGKAPRWLFNRMVNLSRCIVKVIVEEYGQQEFLARLANPHWFQAFSCVLAYDFHSSGTTTVTCATLKTAFDPEVDGLAVAGGKGRSSRQAPMEIEKISKIFGFSDEEVNKLKYASRISAKVDNTAIQAGYPLYHHAFFIDKDGRWLVIQQGMNLEDRTARRYHWLSDHVKNYVIEPHEAVVGDVVKNKVLDMTSRNSEGSRKASVDLVNDGPERIKRSIVALRPKQQTTLKAWIDSSAKDDNFAIDFLRMPRNVDWNALKRAYELHPSNYEELLGVRGIGPSTVRGLALVSEIIYGENPSWKDPVKYSFAYGGKDGVPFPVDRKAMDDSIDFLKEAVGQAKIGERDKLLALSRLKTISANS